MIEPSEFAQAAIGRRVEVVDFPDGRLEARYKGRSMPYRTFDKLRRVTETAVLENKRLGGLLTLIRDSQETQPPGMRTSKGPKRRDQTKHMFSVGRRQLALSFSSAIEKKALAPFDPKPISRFSLFKIPFSSAGVLLSNILAR